MSATLIARDESSFIDECLSSLAGNVDEIVVVDTGSRDDTVEKARRFPVKLRHFRWRDDFSAVRNFAIEQASGAWILYIDADERLELPNPDALACAVEDRSKVAWKLRLHPRVGWTAYSELRLFRNDPRIRFRGVIHERVHADVELVARADALDIGTTDVTLRHVGYESDQSYKNARNIPLLRAYLDRDPGRVYCWWHLGESLRTAGDEIGAVEAWERGIATVRAQERGTLRLSEAAPFLSLIKLLYVRGAPVSDLLGEALALFPQHLALQWVSAMLALERGKIDATLPILERLSAIDPDTFFDPDLAYDKALFTYQSQEALALCHFRAGRFRDAAHYYRVAARAAPDPAACELKARLAEQRAAT